MQPSAKCPRCFLLMYLDNSCPHCGHKLSDFEKLVQEREWIKARNKGYILGCIIFPLLLIALYFIFS